MVANTQVLRDTLDFSDDSQDTLRVGFELGSLCGLLIKESEQYARVGQLAYALQSLERASQFTDLTSDGNGARRDFERAVCNAYDSFFTKNTHCSRNSPVESEIVEARCIVADIFGNNLPHDVAERVSAAYTLLQRRSNPYSAAQHSDGCHSSLPEDFVAAPDVPEERESSYRMPH
jgi:hypothetical protein